MSESVFLVDPVTGAPVLANVSLENCFAIIASQIFPYVVPRTGSQQTPYLLEPFLLDCQSFSVGFHLATNATQGQIIKADLSGDPSSGGVGMIT